MFEIFISTISLAVFFNYLKAKFLKIPDVIGIMILSIIVSLLFTANYFVDLTYFNQELIIAVFIISHSLHSKVILGGLKNYMNIFWKLLDKIFNTVLFVLIGIIMITLDFNIYHLILGVISIFLVIILKCITILLSNLFLQKTHRANKNETVIQTWAGLKRGIIYCT